MNIIPGLFYFNNIEQNPIATDIPKSDQTIKELDNLNWTPLSNHANSRLVQHYGFKYNYTTYKINEPCAPIPNFLIKYADILRNICLQLQLIDNNYQFNQCIVNNYEKGQGISPHIDVRSYGGVIGCFTIGSGATMTFEKDGITHEIYVEPNSLYIMSGDARYTWKHSMVGRKSDMLGETKINRDRRISLTFRNVPL